MALSPLALHRAKGATLGRTINAIRRRFPPPPSAEPDLFAGVGAALSSSAPQAPAAPSSEPDLFAGVGDRVAAASALERRPRRRTPKAKAPQSAPDATADNLALGLSPSPATPTTAEPGMFSQIKK